MLALLAGGCPGVKTAATTPTKCTTQFARCKLPTGPLGVCDLGPCEDGSKAQCLRCVPQH